MEMGKKEKRKKLSKRNEFRNGEMKLGRGRGRKD